MSDTSLDLYKKADSYFRLVDFAYEILCRELDTGCEQNPGIYDETHVKQVLSRRAHDEELTPLLCSCIPVGLTDAIFQHRAFDHASLHAALSAAARRASSPNFYRKGIRNILSANQFWKRRFQSNVESVSKAAVQAALLLVRGLDADFKVECGGELRNSSGKVGGECEDEPKRSVYAIRNCPGAFLLPGFLSLPQQLLLGDEIMSGHLRPPAFCNICTTAQDSKEVIRASSAVACPDTDGVKIMGAKEQLAPRKWAVKCGRQKLVADSFHNSNGLPHLHMMPGIPESANYSATYSVLERDSDHNSCKFLSHLNPLKCPGVTYAFLEDTAFKNDSDRTGKFNSSRCCAWRMWYQQMEQKGMMALDSEESNLEEAFLFTFLPPPPQLRWSSVGAQLYDWTSRAYVPQTSSLMGMDTKEQVNISKADSRVSSSAHILDSKPVENTSPIRTYPPARPCGCGDGSYLCGFSLPAALQQVASDALQAAGLPLHKMKVMHMLHLWQKWI